MTQSDPSRLYGAVRKLRARAWAVRYRLKNVPETTLITSGSQISRDLKVGEHSYIGPRCRIGPRVEIADYVMLGPEVAIIGADHRIDVAGTPMIFAGRPDLNPTTIERDVWVGFRSTIMAGVTIGRGAVVAANAVITSDVAPYSIVGGVPARLISMRFEESMQEIHDVALINGSIEANYAPRKGSK